MVVTYATGRARSTIEPGCDNEGRSCDTARAGPICQSATTPNRSRIGSEFFREESCDRT
jgi:hypothetical protein